MSRSTSDFELLDQPATVVAPLLLGCQLVRQIGGREVVVRIVETEAYDQADAASHSYHGVTPRTSVMFGPSGYLYVYFTYGMHYCCNIVTGGIGQGSAVLIRAVEPLDADVSALQLRRPAATALHNLTNGPAKLCQALDIALSLNGHDLREAPCKLVMQSPLPASAMQVAKRVGITKAVDELRRFYIKDNPYVSVKA